MPFTPFVTIIIWAMIPVARALGKKKAKIGLWPVHTIVGIELIAMIGALIHDL